VIDRLLPKRSDARPGKRLLSLLHALCPPIACRRFDQAPPIGPFGAIDARYRLQQADTILSRRACQHFAIGGDRLEQIDGVAKTRGVFW